MEQLNNSKKNTEITADIFVPKKFNESVAQSLPETQVGTGVSRATTSLQSPNYKQGVSGWILEPNGRASFNNPVPASASSPGIPGTFAYNSTHFFVCIAKDTWKRVAISTW